MKNSLSSSAKDEILKRGFDSACCESTFLSAVNHAGMIDVDVIGRECCTAAYVSGAFVGLGSLSAAKSGYHLEFVFGAKKLADRLIELLSDYGINAKYTERKKRHIVYLKENDSVADCLALAGAQKAALLISDMYVNRQVRQQSNRQINCDMANLDRTVGTGVRQAELFFQVVDELKDEKLKTTAKTRINNPEASYEQLAGMLNITKSGVKHRLKRLEEIALGHDKE